MSLLVEESKNNKMNLLEVEKFEVKYIINRTHLVQNQEEKNLNLINFVTKL
jgi:hypothetical protein